MPKERFRINKYDFGTPVEDLVHNSADDSSNWEKVYSLIAPTMIKLKFAFTEDVKL